jgi:hypothetical protein
MCKQYHLKIKNSALMIEAVSTSETSVNFNQTARRNNPEDSHLHTHLLNDDETDFSSCLAD